MFIIKFFNVFSFQKLLYDKEILQTRKNYLKNLVESIVSKYESLKAELADNETNTQVIMDFFFYPFLLCLLFIIPYEKSQTHTLCCQVYEC